MHCLMITTILKVFVVTLFIGESLEVCVPTNWNYSWTKVGNVWFTRSKQVGTWDQMITVCEGIENGRTNMAAVNTDEEKKHLVSTFQPKTGYWWWISGSRIGATKWFWYKSIGGKHVINEMKKTFWVSGHPRNYKYNDDCIRMYRYSGEWVDFACIWSLPAICELRC